MAVDSLQKRWGLLSDGPPLPNGVLDVSDRLLLVDLFGIEAEFAPPVPSVAGGGRAKKQPRRAIGDIVINFDLGSLFLKATVSSPVRKPIKQEEKLSPEIPVPHPQGTLGAVFFLLEIMGGMRISAEIDNSVSDKAIEEELIQVILLTS